MDTSYGYKGKIREQTALADEAIEIIGGFHFGELERATRRTTDPNTESPQDDRETTYLIDSHKRSVYSEECEARLPMANACVELGMHFFVTAKFPRNA